MGIMEIYQAGVNLGGWISQYSKLEHEHFKSFITKKDIEQIASWGMDHVRIPFDYPVVEDDEKPYEYKEEGFLYIDNCISWCKEYGLNIVLDMHKAPGYSFGTLESNTLFSDERMQDRFIKLWQFIAKRYINERDNVIFELLNEVVDSNSDRWNKLAQKTVEAIREIDKDRYIIIGGNNYNSVYELKNINILDDDKIIYNFHFYEPFLFTHQKASWTEMTRLLNQEQHYPGRYVGIKEFAEKYPKYAHLKEIENQIMDINLLKKHLEPAVEFMKSTNKPLYCGEYGAIDHAPLQSRINWHKDIVELLKELKIGRACWSYKSMNFALVDKDSKVVSEELIKIVSNK
ncbi:glycoside hydrolase family 5 protein [Caldicellulosiruptoraceae bacterium PP1]